MGILEYSELSACWANDDIGLEKTGWRSQVASSNGMWSVWASCGICTDPLLPALPPSDNRMNNYVNGILQNLIGLATK